MGFIKSALNKNVRTDFGVENLSPAFSIREAEIAVNFHSSIPRYYPTPLVKLNSLASRLGLSNIFIKDESKRFGINSFKVLGGAYAISRFLYSKLGRPYTGMDFEALKAEHIKMAAGDMTFATASDGNHGMGVAWTAQNLGYRAVVYLPEGTTAARINNIRETGAEVKVTSLGYDDTVSLAAEEASKNGWELIQDTAFENYKMIPEWIMQGYMTLIYEAVVQMKTMGVERPTHIFLQAGVGSMAAAVTAYLVVKFGARYPVTAIVEPDRAACHFESYANGDGNPHPAEGDLKTMMAGLSCGVPNPIAWEIIHNYADMYFTCDDDTAAEGMRLLAKPEGGDSRIISGESGAVTAGLLMSLMQDVRYEDIRKRAELGENSNVLLISTEGDTDPHNYRKITRDTA